MGQADARSTMGGGQGLRARCTLQEVDGGMPPAALHLCGQPGPRVFLGLLVGESMECFEAVVKAPTSVGTDLNKVGPGCVVASLRGVTVVANPQRS